MESRWYKTSLTDAAQLQTGWSTTWPPRRLEGLLMSVESLTFAALADRLGTSGVSWK
jgi:hypothetical protein